MTFLETQAPEKIEGTASVEDTYVIMRDLKST